MRGRDGGQLVAATSRFKLPDLVGTEVVGTADARPHHMHDHVHVVRSIGGPLDVLVSLAHLLGALAFHSCIDRLDDGLGVP